MTGQQITPTKKKQSRVIGTPRKPRDWMLRYCTAFYASFDPTKPKDVPPPITEAFSKFSQFDDYLLYTSSPKSIELIPTQGVRLDDLAVAWVLMSGMSKKVLNQNWPAEFDTKGMVRASRVPLGRAAKVWITAGQKDLDGEEAGKSGYYYRWWGGIHALVGEEGFEHYLTRPSFEDFRCSGFGWKVSGWAIQKAEEGQVGVQTKSRRRDAKKRQ